MYRCFYYLARKLTAMNETIDTNDRLNADFGPAKLPTGLNVLTILTFIGCAIFGLLTLLSPMITKFFLGMMDKAGSSETELTPKQIADMEEGRKVLELSQANMIPLMVIGLIGIALCFIGALMMRKLKKDGFWIYVGGQLLPLAGTIAIMGTAQFTGITSYLMFLIPIVFIVLYSRQRKYLIN